MKDRPEQPRSYRNMLKNVAILSGMWGMGIGAAFVQIPAGEIECFTEDLTCTCKSYVLTYVTISSLSSS